MVVRTRMAPSPTGEFHIGGMRTLLYNYALAKKNNGQFILRIEDTDRARLVPGALDRLLQVIKDYGLSWDEGPQVLGPYAPYVQSERLSIYKDHVQKLLDSGHAYYCFCSKERLETLRTEQKNHGIAATKYDKHCAGLSKEEIDTNLAQNLPYVVRLNVQPGIDIEYADMFLGKVVVNSSELDDQVLLKSDGFPTYHLAVVVDDHLMKISHIMRGVEWLPSTPKHILLYKAFGWELPHIGHLPNLKDVSSTKKLSKRDGSVNATEFLKDGYLSQALLNFLMFLGWNPGTEKEIYSLEEFINDFSIEKIHKTDLVSFDRDRLNWINGYYIRQLSPQDFYKSYLTWAERFDTPINLNLRDSTKGTKVLQMIQERVKKYSEVASMIQYFFEEPYVDAYTLSQFAKEANPKDIITNFWLFYKDFKSWEKEELDKLSHEFIRDKGYKPKEAFMTIRVAITGEVATPPLFDVLEFVGKQGVMSRLEKSLKLLN